MKRMLEHALSIPNKYKHKFIGAPQLPPELWQHINLLLDNYSRASFRLTSMFFARDSLITAKYYQNLISENIFDFAHENELLNYIKLPINAKKSHQLTHIFKDKLIKTILLMNNTIQTYPFQKNANYSNLLPILFEEVKNGNLLIINYLILNFPDFMGNSINEIDNNQITTVGYAAKYGRKTIFFKLLKIAAANEVQPFLIDEITLGEDLHLMLHDLGINFIAAMTPVHIIALRSDRDWLLAIFNDYPEMIEIIFTNDYKNALICILKNDYQEFKRILNRNVHLTLEKDVAGWTLLHWAATFTYTNIYVEYFFEKKWNVDIQTISPIFLAIATNNLNLLKLLNEKGLAIQPYFNNNTCVHLAASNGHLDCLKYLIEECNQDMNAKNNVQENALFYTKLIDNDGVKLSSALIEKKTACYEFLLIQGKNNAKLTQF